MTRPVEKIKSADAAAMALSVDRSKGESLHIQLAQQLRDMILSGRIAPGARLPSSRALGVDLRVSRATIVLTYDQLASEGYVEGRQGAGMFVSSSIPENSLQLAAPSLSAHSVMLRRANPRPPEPVRPFQIGATDPTLFPYRHWARLLYRIWRKPGPELVAGTDAFGWWALRAAVAEHLKEWRGIICHADRIVVTSGVADAIELIARCAFEQGDAVYVEEPGYPPVRYTLRNAGLELSPVLVDRDGFDLDRALRQRPGRGAVVTPSRHFPLGATLPLSRRLALLDWAASVAGYIVEDDFDSEYRYEGAPLPALTSLDQSGRTIYIGSFSKVLSPTLRLGFVVLPERLVGAARNHLRQRGSTASMIAQPVLAEFIADGGYATHIRRTRRVYARRLAALLAQGDRLTGLLDFSPTPAGMHIVANLSPKLALRMSDWEAAERARGAGIVTAALTDYHALRPKRPALLLGFAGFPEETFQAAIGALVAAIR